MTPRLIPLAVLLVMSGCGDDKPPSNPADANPPDLDAPAPDATCPSLQEATAQIEFTDIVTTPGCVFFSGPGDLGVEFQLGDQGTITPTELAIGPALFALEDGDTYTRTEQCPFFGSPWRFTERMSGTWAGSWPTEPSCAGEPAVFTGTYSYKECGLAPNRLCPEDSSMCVITANVTIRVVE